MAFRWLRTFVGLEDVPSQALVDAPTLETPAQKGRKKRPRNSMDDTELDEVQKLFRKVKMAATAEPMGSRVRFPDFDDRISTTDENSNPADGPSGHGMLRPDDYMLIPDGFILGGAHQFTGNVPGQFRRQVEASFGGRLYALEQGSVCVRDTVNREQLDRIDLFRWGLVPLGLYIDEGRLCVALEDGTALAFKVS